MSHSETQIHSTDLLQWLLSASSLANSTSQLIWQQLHICQEPHFLPQSISSTSIFKLCSWWMSPGEGIGTVRWRKQQAISFPCSYFSSLKKKRVVSKTTLNCQHFSQVKVTQSIDSCVLFSINFRLIATTLWFWFSLGFVLSGCLTSKKYSVYFRKEVPSSCHAWLRVLENSYNLRKEGTEIIFLPYLLHTNRPNDPRSQSIMTWRIHTGITETFSRAGMPLELHLLCPWGVWRI